MTQTAAGTEAFNGFGSRPVLGRDPGAPSAAGTPTTAARPASSWARPADRSPTRIPVPISSRGSRCRTSYSPWSDAPVGGASCCLETRAGDAAGCSMTRNDLDSSPHLTTKRLWSTEPGPAPRLKRRRHAGVARRTTNGRNRKGTGRPSRKRPVGQ